MSHRERETAPIRDRRIGRFNLTELIAGGCVIALGLFGLWESTGYRLGTARAMGPGYFPTVLSFLLITVGVGIVAVEGSRTDTEPADQPAWRGLVTILTAICVFAFVVERFGIVPACIAAVLLSSLADRETTMVRSLTLALVIAAFSYIIFIQGLGMPVEPFHW